MEKGIESIPIESGRKEHGSKNQESRGAVSQRHTEKGAERHRGEQKLVTQIDTDYNG